VHHDEWLHIKMKGERKSNSDIIKDALAAKQDVSRPALSQEEAKELDRLAARDSEVQSSTEYHDGC